MRREKLWHGLMTAIACLLVFCICATFIADTYAVDINTRFGTSNYVVANDEADSDVDTTYFKSEFSTLGELIEAKDALSVQIAAEGSVLLKNENQALPLNIAAETITLWGLNSHSPTMGGMIGSSVAVDSEHGQLI